MAKEKVYSEVLNLRIDEAMSREIKRVAVQHENLESDTARMLIGWGIEAHRDMEAQELLRPYDAEERHGRNYPLEMRVCVRWEETDPYEPDE
jgi:hypothetical protein